MLPATFFDLMQASFQLLATVLITCIFFPWVILILPVITIFFTVLRQYYIKTSRQIKRLEAISRSPVYSNIPATLEGLATLRSFGHEDISMETFYKLQNDNTRVYLYWFATSRWLGLRLDMVAIIFLTTIIVVVLLLNAFGGVNVGFIGLVMSYVLQLLTFVQWAVRQSAEVENQMISVERIIEYTRIKPEGNTNADQGSQTVSVSENWPQNGAVEFDQVSMSYPSTSKLVLKNVCFSINPGQKIGLVGRTGSGKSSIFQSLFRFLCSFFTYVFIVFESPNHRVVNTVYFCDNLSAVAN